MKNKLVEWCSNCNQEILLEPVYQLTQRCPNCGAPIKACTLCDNDFVNCTECDKGICQKWKMPDMKCCMHDPNSCKMCGHYQLCPLYKKATN